MTGNEPHRLRLRVYWEDTDAGGIVYYANYLRYAERARAEILLERGIRQSDIRESLGVILPVREVSVRYLAPARLEDELEVVTRVDAIEGARIVLGQDVLRAGQVLAAMRVVIACMSPEGRPRRVPALIREAFPHAPRRAEA